jgi:hypothetical protein
MYLLEMNWSPAFGLPVFQFKMKEELIVLLENLLAFEVALKIGGQGFSGLLQFPQAAGFGPSWPTGSGLLQGRN